MLDTAIDDDIEQCRAPSSNSSVQRWPHGAWFGDTFRGEAKGLGHSGKINLWFYEIHTHVGIAFLEGAQSLLQNAVAFVVGDHEGDRQIEMCRGP